MPCCPLLSRVRHSRQNTAARGRVLAEVISASVSSINAVHVAILVMCQSGSTSQLRLLSLQCCTNDASQSTHVGNGYGAASGQTVLALCSTCFQLNSNVFLCFCSSARQTMLRWQMRADSAFSALMSTQQSQLLPIASADAFTSQQSQRLQSLCLLFWSSEVG